MGGKKNESVRWDDVHKRISEDSYSHSLYALEKEKLFPRNSIVCDLGGGMGLDALYFLKRGHKVILLDISDFALRFAKKLANDVKLSGRLATKQADFGLEGIPLKNDSVDVCYSRIGLNYFPAAETSSLFSDVYRILKPGGKAFLAFKSPDDREEMIFLKNKAVEMEDGVFIEEEQIRSRFTSEQLKRITAKARIKNFDVQVFVEPQGMLRDESNISRDKPLYLNEVTFTK